MILRSKQVEIVYNYDRLFQRDRLFYILAARNVSG